MSRLCMQDDNNDNDNESDDNNHNHNHGNLHEQLYNNVLFVGIQPVQCLLTRENTSACVFCATCVCLSRSQHISMSLAVTHVFAWGRKEEEKTEKKSLCEGFVCVGSVNQGSCCRISLLVFFLVLFRQSTRIPSGETLPIRTAWTLCVLFSTGVYSYLGLSKRCPVFFSTAKKEKKQCTGSLTDRQRE